MWKGLLLAALIVATFAFVPSLAGSSEKPGDIAWQTSIPQDTTEARPTLLYFTADWCPPCKAMKANAWPDERVEAILKASYTPVYVDIDADPAAAQAYGVEQIPTIKILKAGEVVASANYFEADGLVEFLKQHAE